MEFFEIVKDDQDRRVVRIFGHKICRFKPTKRFLIRKLLNELKLIKGGMDITHIPPAKGWLRDLQLANLAIMKEVAKFCDEYGLTYWMSDGTLLGAVRHGGFIPWDDDIDLAMPREDFDRFVSEFNSIAHTHLYATYVGDNNHHIIKVYHKTIPHLFVDIFVYDYYYGRLDGWDARCELTKKIKEKQRAIKTPLDAEGCRLFYKKWRDEELCGLNDGSFDGKPIIYRGLDYLTAIESSLFYDYDDFFPLRKLKFEGIEFAAPQRPHVYLTCCYGDYMAFPNKRYGGYHTEVNSMTLAEVMAIKAWLEEMGMGEF